VPRNNGARPEETPPDARYNVGIKELPSDERPRERLLKYGPSSLSAAELIAIVLRTGTRDQSAISLAQALLHKHGGLRGLSRASIADIKKLKGVGDVKGIQIAAFVELGKRLAVPHEGDDPPINSPDDAAQLLMPFLRGSHKEEFWALLLNTKNSLIRKVLISVGGLDSSIVQPAAVFKEAVAGGARSIIVVHNHPSGDPTPSPEDRLVTARLVEAGKVMGIDVLDHLILGDGRYVSLKERGMM